MNSICLKILAEMYWKILSVLDGNILVLLWGYVVYKIKSLISSSISTLLPHHISF